MTSLTHLHLFIGISLPTSTVLPTARCLKELVCVAAAPALELAMQSFALAGTEAQPTLKNMELSNEPETLAFVRSALGHGQFCLEDFALMATFSSVHCFPQMCSNVALIARATLLAATELCKALSPTTLHRGSGCASTQGKAGAWSASTGLQLELLWMNTK
jgi:hypothetical protein